MTDMQTKHLHWTQRIALVRHNLHSASRSGNFGFFKTLQACVLMESINDAATLSATLGDDADSLLATIDNINASLALAHQKAFEEIYECSKDLQFAGFRNARDRRTRLRAEITHQKEANSTAIDRLVNAVTKVIDMVMADSQDVAADVWITGVTIVADSMETVLQEMHAIASGTDDLDQLEESSNTVRAAVASAIAGLKGVFSLMNNTAPLTEDTPPTVSFASMSYSVFRRVSSAFQSQGPSRANSISSLHSPIETRRSSLRAFHYPQTVLNPGNRAEMLMQNGFDFHKLRKASPTLPQEDMDPLDTRGSLAQQAMGEPTVSSTQTLVS